MGRPRIPDAEKVERQIREFKRKEMERVQRQVEEHLRKIIELLSSQHEGERDFVHLDLENTPARVSRMWCQETLSYPEMPALHLTEMPANVLALGPIGFSSTCAHHMLPFTGHAWAGYLADGKVLGLSKFTRVVKAYSKRFQLQERLTSQVCDFLAKHMEPKVLIVVMKAQHGCISCRGVEDPNQNTVTSALYHDSDERPHEIIDEIYRVIEMTNRKD